MTCEGDLRRFCQTQTKKRPPSPIKLDVDGYLTLLNAKCNLDKICVHKEFAMVREDPKDRLDIHICFLKEDRSTRHNLQTEAFQETSTMVHFFQKDWQDLYLLPLETKSCLPYQTSDSSSLNIFHRAWLHHQIFPKWSCNVSMTRSPIIHLTNATGLYTLNGTVHDRAHNNLQQLHSFDVNLIFWNANLILSIQTWILWKANLILLDENLNSQKRNLDYLNSQKHKLDSFAANLNSKKRELHSFDANLNSLKRKLEFSETQTSFFWCKGFATSLPGSLF